MQLDIGGARYHAPDVGHCRIRSHRARQSGVAQPDAAASLDRGGQRHVVDQRPAHRRHPADTIQRPPAQQHRAAGRGRGRAQRIVHPHERVEQLEEIHEGGHQRVLRRRSRMPAPPSRRPGPDRRARPAPPASRDGAAGARCRRRPAAPAQPDPPPPVLAPRPTACRSSLAGLGCPSSTTRFGSPIPLAIAPVPSRLPSSTTMTRSGPA